MAIYRNGTFDEERALYGSKGIEVECCAFDGPADGESALKECSDVVATQCHFNLRYPFWHNKNVKITECEMTELCRAALWYDDNVEIVDCTLHGIKALRECTNVKIKKCDIISPEFGWSVDNLIMQDCSIVSEYFMMRSRNLKFERIKFNGKYSFQYIEDAEFNDCVLDTKDAFWHAKNITIKNSLVKGEYLAWYCENVTFENCTIVGTQPFCYCKNLKLINCEMIDCDLAFERSEVDAVITTKVDSIKNPLSGVIRVPEVGEIIRDIPEANGMVIAGEIANKDAK